ncbi:penicillin acylase family protein [Pleomorphovibrio marinus]|uniref:penicillin acylase family protein n=1 Tax=Pleomorphovibrio marinus TaxID=2164132 RepID=UPI0013007F7E|nr:penicillin acylase family protein [Pleomorphovibrio marinus]
MTLFLTLCLVLGLSLNLASLPPLANIFDPFRGFWQNLNSEDYHPSSKIKVPGLSSQVEVVYDENLIPHIYAEETEDLYKALGFVTAKHRLWQMDFLVKVASGSLSEVLGDLTLDYDRMQRRKGLGYGAEENLTFIQENDPESYAKLQAYSEGVNAFIDQISFSELPLEYKLLNYLPSRWEPISTIYILQYMVDDLTRDTDFEYTNLRFMLGKELFDELFPDFSENLEPVIREADRWDFEPIPISVPDTLSYPDSLLWVNTVDKAPQGLGSNNWAVSGSKTSSGAAILANDPHLGLRFPAIWFGIQLQGPDVRVKGVTVPGAPLVAIGFNDQIAWGLTNSPRDLRDWYHIEFRDESKSEYLYNQQWLPTTQRIEHIKVKNAEDIVDTVYYTHHGPVAYDESFRSGHQGKGFALKWAVNEPANTLKAFFTFNEAKDFDAFLGAFDQYVNLAQNYAYADINGNIGMSVQGKFPAKWAEQGKFIMDGSDPAFDWQEYIPFDHNPTSYNPDRGFVSSANQHAVEPDYPYYYFNDHQEAYRNRRINQQLEQMENVTVEDMKALQFDNFHLKASETVPVLLSLLSSKGKDREGQGLHPMVSLLQDWDFHTDPEQVAPVIFEIWWENLVESIFSHWKDELPSVVYPRDYTIYNLLSESPDHVIFDKPGNNRLNTAMDHVAESFEFMLDSVDSLRASDPEFTWGSYKNTSVQHLIPLFGAFSRLNIPTGGGKNIVNATDRSHGASWRMVVEMGDPIKAYGIFPGGQSGNPGSRFYDNFIDLWAQGKYVQFDFREIHDEGDLFRTSLVPN